MPIPPTPLPNPAFAGVPFGTGVSLLFQSSTNTNVWQASSPAPTGNNPNWGLAALQAGINVISAPAAAAGADGTVWTVYRGAGDTSLWYASSGNGWTNQPVSGTATQLSPGLAIMNGTLYAAFVRADTSPQDPCALAVAQARVANPVWSATTVSPFAVSDAAPSLTTLDDKLFMLYDVSGRHFLIQSADGVTWSNPAPLPAPFATTCSPAITALDGRLYALRVSSIDNTLWLYTSADEGAHWDAGNQLPTYITTRLAPALVGINGTLYIAFGSSGNDGTIWITSSQDMNVWEGPLQLPPAITFGAG